MTATTRRFDPSALINTRYLSVELREGTWTLSFTADFWAQVVRRRVTSRDREGVWCEKTTEAGKSAPVTHARDEPRETRGVDLRLPSQQRSRRMQRVSEAFVVTSTNIVLTSG